MSHNQTEITNDNWWKFAACKGLDVNLFVPDKTASHYEIADAKAVCKRCSVIQHCLDYALSLNDDVSGVWGGTSGKDRRRMRSARGTRVS